VIDYPEPATVPGLNLQCTPGNGVECVTDPGGRQQFWMLRGSPGHCVRSTAHGLLFMLSWTAIKKEIPLRNPRGWDKLRRRQEYLGRVKEIDSTVVDSGQTKVSFS
jgi:hypothetical protein